MKNLLSLCGFLLLAIPCQARIITVGDDGSADFDNIQAAIDDANDGDIIEVQPGRYIENINFLGKNIILRSTEPTNPDIVANTIIDGSTGGSVVTFSGRESPACMLSGFTITNGYAGRGGGVFCDNKSNPTLVNCVISGNTSYGGGGGIECEQSSPTFIDCTISGNTAYGGGGLFCRWGNVELTNCTFTNNSTFFDEGGGISCFECDMTLTNCTFSGNSAFFCGGGICFSSLSSHMLSSHMLTNCTFTGNSATLGGAVFNDGSDLTLTNCTLSSNLAEYGGGMWCNDGNSTLVNCIVLDNMPEEIFVHSGRAQVATY
jgi:hypothetical protein